MPRNQSSSQLFTREEIEEEDLASDIRHEAGTLTFLHKVVRQFSFVFSWGYLIWSFPQPCIQHNVPTNNASVTSVCWNRQKYHYFSWFICKTIQRKLSILKIVNWIRFIGGRNYPEIFPNFTVNKVLRKINIILRVKV